MNLFISAAFALAFSFWLISAIAFLRLCRRVGLIVATGMLVKIVWVKRAIDSESDAQCRI